MNALQDEHPPGSPGRPARKGLRWAVFLLLVCLGLGLSAAFALERFPPPEFEPGTYTMPPTTTPAARAQGMEYLDMALLLATLSLSAYFVLVRRLRKPVFWLMVFSLGYFGFVRKGCVCPIGSTQDVVLALFNPEYAVPFSVVVFFLLPLLFTLFFGRVFCAAVCPLGAIQDVMLWKPVKVKPWLEQALGLLPFLYLGAAVLFAATSSAFIICEYDPFVSFFRRSGSLTMLALGAGFLVVGMFVGRPYCRFLCPYGGLLGLLSRISKWNVVLTPDDCIRCQICDVACPYGAITQPSETAVAPPPETARKRLRLTWLLLPVLVLAGGLLGGQLAVPLSKLNRTVRLAERIALEESTPSAARPIVATNLANLNPAERNAQLASKAFRQTGQPTQELFTKALALRRQFSMGGLLLGAFMGLVMGAKLVSLARPEVHSIYEPDRATCLACGRCYSYCPKELVRVKKLEKATSCRP